MELSGAKKPYVKPTVSSDDIYETMALSCVQCNVGREEFGFGDGNCEAGYGTY